MASPRKSGGAKSAPSEKASAPVDTAYAVETDLVAEAPTETDEFAAEVATDAELAPVETVAAHEPPAAVIESAVEPEAIVAPAAIMEPTTVTKTKSLVIVTFADVTKMMDMNKFMEAPMASFTEAQEKARSMAETSINETRAKLAQLKTASDEAVNAMETSFATVKNGAMELNTKALEAMQAAAESSFDFMKSMFSVKSPSEFVTLQTKFARKQIEAMQTSSKALGELAQKLATDSVEPIKAQVSKTFNMPV